VDNDDAVFKALADPTRRAVLDRLRERNGQTLGELCGPLEMARQSATQHLGVLETANLISTVRRGREKLHYLNPVPLWDIQDRWIEKFERPRLRALSAIKQQAEEDTMADRPSYVYVTYIESSPERVWEALTDPGMTGEYWGHSNVSDWQAGSPWEHRRTDGSGIADVTGTVLDSVAPRRLTMTFDAPGGTAPGGPSTVTFDIEPYHEIVRLTVTHENLADDEAFEAASAGWPSVCANLKSLLETGHVLPRAPWEMHAELRAAQMARNDRVQSRLVEPTASERNDSDGEMTSATAVAVIIQRGRVLMIKGRVNGERFSWQFPLGEIAAAEDAHEAALREAREQVGLRVQPSSVLGERFVEAISKRLIYVACTPLGAAEAKLANPGGATELAWCTFGEFMERVPGGLFPPVVAHLRNVLDP
jgi:uncharacterized protein YndB with AHSA1/START domain/8-oxo-dGTP pyrophosphatase MutT (NUDIX family)/DNA-binding transcriptional ArsR family regulator